MNLPGSLIGLFDGGIRGGHFNVTHDSVDNFVLHDLLLSVVFEVLEDLDDHEYKPFVLVVGQLYPIALRLLSWLLGHGEVCLVGSVFSVHGGSSIFDIDFSFCYLDVGGGQKTTHFAYIGLADHCVAVQARHSFR